MTSNPSDEEIIKGWERIATDYIARELTTKEKHQIEMAALIERQAKEKHFVLP